MIEVAQLVNSPTIAGLEHLDLSSCELLHASRIADSPHLRSLRRLELGRGVDDGALRRIAKKLPELRWLSAPGTNFKL